MQNLGIPFDRELVSSLARTYGAAAGSPAHVVFRSGTNVMETIGLFRAGLVRTLRTPTANHIPYAAAAAARNGLAEVESVRATTFDGRLLPPLDLLHLRGVPQSIIQGRHLNGGAIFTAFRNHRYILRLLDHADSAFNHAPSGDGKRLRALARSFGARFREVPPQHRIEAVGQICDMFAVRAMARGIAGVKKLAADRAAAISIAAHGSARVFVIENDTEFISGAFGLVAGDTFYGLVSSGVTEGAIGKRSPARLVKIAALESMREEGICAYDFGLSASPEKMMVCNIEEPVYDVLVPFTFAGRTAAWAARASRFVRSRLRDSETFRSLRGQR
jgi:CelD/BcsL family acetyltransferase involved in cellulose biosynthesis